MYEDMPEELWSGNYCCRRPPRHLLRRRSILPPSISPTNFVEPPHPNFGGSFLLRVFNTNVIIIMAVVLVVIVLSIVVRCHVMRRLRLQQQLHPTESQQQQVQKWHLHRGLRKEQIEVLPVITFGNLNVEGDGTMNNCVVCLSDYQKGDKVRLLPLCKHSFHLDCIDAWLSTHTSCPVCRHSVLQQQPTDDHHHTTADPTSEADHQSSAATTEDSQNGTPSNNAQHGDVQCATDLGRRSTRLGRSAIIFGRARVVSATTTIQQHMEIEVEPGTRRRGDVAGGNRS